MESRGNTPAALGRLAVLRQVIQRQGKDMEDSTRLKDEYHELGQTMRHYSALRFAMLTVFFALVVGIITISFDATNADKFVMISTRIGGLIVTLAFWVFEYRLEVYMRHFERRVADLETALGYNIYTGRKFGGVRFINTPLAIRILYFSVLVFWATSLFILVV